MYVADRDNDRIQVFDGDGTHLDSWGGLDFPNHIFITADQDVWVADSFPSKMVKFDTEGNRQYSWLNPARGPARFGEVHQFSIDAAGNWYGADNLLGRTQKFTPKAGADSSHLIGQPLPLAGGSRQR